jgi:hypothetical protein
LKHNLQLVELLEIPQLVEACARNGFHDEALELASFANSLERKYLIATEIRDPVSSSSSPTDSHPATQSNLKTKDSAAAGAVNSVSGGKNIVQSIVNDVHKTLSDLRCQLLQKLSEEAALPKLLTILSSLRKLDGIFVDRKVSLENHHHPHSLPLSSPLEHTIQQQQQEHQRQRQYEILSKYVETSLQMSYLEARSIWIQRMITNVYQNSYQSELQNKIMMNSLEINSDIHSNSPNVSSPPPMVRSPSSSTNQSSHLGSYGKGIEILEIYRSSWFSVITQFNALFLNSTSESSSLPSSSFSSSSPSCPSITLLSHWIHDQLQHFINDIHCILHEIDEIISFKLYYEQVLLFSIRMSEIGCDFKELIIPIFENNLKQRIEKIWWQGMNQFKQMILTEKYLPRPSAHASSLAFEDENHQVSTEREREREGDSTNSH